MRVTFRRQSGQALILFLGFAAAMVAALLVAFNVGQTTNAKMRAMNAADAAAYSGAVWQARTLNLEAYLNRAMVVNEVAIAQSVSLRSWVSYLQKFVQNINYIAEFIPYVGEATTAVSDVLTEVNQVVQQTLPYAEAGLRGLNFATNKLQVGVNVIGAAVAQDLASNVARANGAKLSAAAPELFAKNELRWNAFTKDYVRSNGRVGSDGRTRLREVALNSRDGFTTARDWTAGIPFLFQFRKQGGTDMLNFDAWKGLDSAELRTVYVPAKGWTVKTPIGWGGAQAADNRLNLGYGRHGNINEWGDADGKLAIATSNKSPNGSKISSTIGTTASPFPNYRDIADPSKKVADLHLPFAVEVVIDKAQIQTSNSALNARAITTSGNVVDAAPNFASGNSGVFALAEACVRFGRPYGAERNGIEYPSLYSPYWRASLATVSRTSRLIADGVKGLPESALLEGTGTCS